MNEGILIHGDVFVGCGAGTGTGTGATITGTGAGTGTGIGTGSSGTLSGLGTGLYSHAICSNFRSDPASLCDTKRTVAIRHNLITNIMVWETEFAASMV